MNKEELLALIKQTIQQIDTLEMYLETLSDKRRVNDYQISDLLHFIENNDIKAKDSNKLIKLIKEKRVTRKDLMKQDSIREVWNNNINKLTLKTNRQFLLHEINKRDKSLDTEYRYRELNEEQLKDL